MKIAGRRGGRLVAGVAAILMAGAAWGAPPADHRQVLAGRWFHAPVADDDCTVCHTMHRGPVGAALQAPVPELCYQCHENVAAQDVVHEPVGEGRCTDCHRVHTSEERPLLIKRIPELCMDCHPIDEAHVARNTLCTSCHGVHSSATARFLKGERTRNCGRCHGDKRKGESLHAPAREGKCLNCHYTHPDPRFVRRGLRGPYPLELRAPFRLDAYRLCRGCHDLEGLADPRDLSTRFRTAAQNLHARHLRGPDGVACYACHDVHASSRAALVRDWLRPPEGAPVALSFLQFSTGGSCGPSCHGAATYVREEEQAEIAPEGLR